MDWDNIKAADLFKVFDGFTPVTGKIKSVKIYPSEFGKERMQHEALHGPPKAIFKELSEEKKRPKAKSLVNPDEGKDFHGSQLRKYQLDRLRYYYAVVECDSVSSARAIYQACDGAEYESSSNFFDLRYVPDAMDFEDEPHDEANASPQVYEPKDFLTTALQHTNVQLTWDNDDPERTKMTKRKFTREDILNMDFKSYIASASEDEEEEDPEEVKRKYLSLLNDGNDEDKEEIGDIEVTFGDGLTDAAEKLLKQKEEKERMKNETVFERKMREKREKRKQQKLEKKMAAEGSESDEGSEEVDSDSDALVSGNELPDDDFFAEEMLEEETKPNGIFCIVSLFIDIC